MYDQYGELPIVLVFFGFYLKHAYIYVQPLLCLIKEGRTTDGGFEEPTDLEMGTLTKNSEKYENGYVY